MRQKILQLMFLVIFSTGTQLNNASTLAYWRFEGDGTNAPTANALLTGFAQHTAVQNNGVLGRDSSANGNTIYSWDSNPNGNSGFWIEY